MKVFWVSYNTEKAPIARVGPEWFKLELFQLEHDGERTKALVTRIKEMEELKMNFDIVLSEQSQGADLLRVWNSAEPYDRSNWNWDEIEI